MLLEASEISFDLTSQMLEYFSKKPRGRGGVPISTYMGDILVYAALHVTYWYTRLYVTPARSYMHQKICKRIQIV